MRRYCSSVLLTHSTCPLADGWWPDVKCKRMQRRAPREQKKCNVNSEPQSEDTWRGIPCLAKTWVTKASATSTAVAVSVEGMKTLSLVRRSMTTKIAI